MNSGSGVRITAGHWIMLRRKELGKSQEQLAGDIGISRTEMSRIELGKCIPTVRTIEKLEDELGLKLYPSFMEERREKEREKKP